MSEPLRKRAEALLVVVAKHEKIAAHVDDGVWRDESECEGRSLVHTDPNALAVLISRYIAAAREELEEALSNLSAFEVGMASRVVDRHLESAAEAIVSRWEKALGVR